MASEFKVWATSLWVLGSIGLTLGHSVVRMSAFLVETISTDLNTVQQVAFLASVIGFGLVEGYIGFHRSFAPRFARRFTLLLASGNNWLLVAGPLFCLGIVPMGRRYQADWLRFLVSTAAIFLMVLAVRQLPFPWRGIVVSGVAVALFLGTLTTISQSLQAASARVQRTRRLAS